MPSSSRSGRGWSSICPGAERLVSYRVAQADLACDRTALVSVWARNLAGPTEERLGWLYSAEGGGRCWLLRTQEGDVVGSTGLAPRRLRIGGRDVPAGQAVDLAVDREHRTLGPAVTLQRALLAELEGVGISLAYAFPNHSSEPILARAGYRTVGAMIRWVKPLRVSHLLRGRLPRWAAARTLSAPVDWAFAAASRDRRIRPPRDLAVTVVDRVEPRFDDLFERAAGQFGLVGDRSAAYLAWRFQRNPERRYEILVLRRGDVLRGYVVYRIDAGIARVADLLADAPESWEWLLAACIGRARAAGLGAVSLVYLGAADVQESLARFGFYQRGRDTSVMVHGEPLSLPPTGEWHLTEADRDA